MENIGQVLHVTGSRIVAQSLQAFAMLLLLVLYGGMAGLLPHPVTVAVPCNRYFQTNKIPVQGSDHLAPMKRCASVQNLGTRISICDQV